MLSRIFQQPSILFTTHLWLAECLEKHFHLHRFYFSNLLHAQVIREKSDAVISFFKFSSRTPFTWCGSQISFKVFRKKIFTFGSSGATVLVSAFFFLVIPNNIQSQCRCRLLLFSIETQKYSNFWLHYFLRSQKINMEIHLTIFNDMVKRLRKQAK